jgi:predicted dehydrogenase
MAALEAGCDVFCEKTMCYAESQARELAAAVEAKQAVFQVGLQRRANAIYRQAAAMVETGMLGQLTAIKCQWHRNNNWRRPVPVEKGHGDWKQLEHRLNWRLYRAYSHGLMTELASHQLDVANWLLGSTPSRVMGSGGIDYWRDGREVFDNLFCIYEYELTGEAEKPYTVRVTFSSIQNNAYEGASELIMGTKGSLFLSSRKGLFYREKGVDDPGWSADGRVEHDAQVITSGKTLKMENDPWAHRGKPYEIDSQSDDTRDELIAFLDCVQRRDVNTICDAQTGCRNALTVLTGSRAIREATVLPVSGE